MVTAEVTLTREQVLAFSHPMQFGGIDWDTYKDISDELEGLRSIHLTYFRTVLTIMPTSDIHELLCHFLGQFMGLVSMATRTNIIPTGQATLRSKMKLLGVEPDLSYFVSTAAGHKLKKYVPDEIDGPPDIVVEIDFTHKSTEKFSIYSELGIPEFWRYAGDDLKMYRLSADARYEQIERSIEIPLLTEKVLTHFLNRVKNEEDEQFVLLTDFQNWLQANK